MFHRRQRRKAIRTLIILLLLMPFLKWGYPVAERLYTQVAGGPPIGPNALTAQKAADLDREVETIGLLIRDRQDSERPAQVEEPTWPVPGHFEITSDFGSRLHPVLNVPKLHAGLDIGAPEGAPVVAYLSGRVILVERFPAYGTILVIDHGEQRASLYAHLSAVAVQVGDLVAQGTPIGRVGSTGAVTGPHLHFEVRVDGNPVDPTGLLAVES